MSRIRSISGAFTKRAGRVVALALSASLISCAPTIPANTPIDTVYWLDQSWSDADRHWAHHASQGTVTLPIPYGWLVALERPSLSFGYAGSFTEPRYLSRFGFIPSPASLRDPVPERFGYARTDTSAYESIVPQYEPKPGLIPANPSQLPVGFARLTGIDPNDGKPFDSVGFTCAACHTGHLEYKGTSVRIDGAPAMTDLGKFRKTLGLALGLTDMLPWRFNRFAERLLGQDPDPKDRKRLKKEVSSLVKRGKARQKLTRPQTKESVEEGFTRLDALTRIGNQIFFSDLMKSEDEATQKMAIANNRPITAPVNFPHIWNTPWFDWVQWDASIKQPMVRNAGEALGVSALVNLTKPGEDLYRSTVAVGEIYALEHLLAGADPFESPRGFKGLRAPEWPEDILGKIDVAKAEEGKALYAKHCKKCHLPAPSNPAFWSDRYWTKKNDAGERYLKVRAIPISAVGTDPGQADVIDERKVQIPSHLGIPAAPTARGPICYDGGKKEEEAVTETLFAWALGVVVDKTVTKWFDDHGVPESERARMNGDRPNCLQAIHAYKARPLDGIWATAPFLHNGSVPNLFALLSPLDERPEKFYLGSRLFDPRVVGYESKKLKGGFALDTSKLGNSNAGHEYSDEKKNADGSKRAGVIGPLLSEDERFALIEFMKTL
jgi:mono/diheme cytochrome c family protein